MGESDRMQSGISVLQPFRLVEIIMNRICPALAMVGLILLLNCAQGANPREVNGFWGNVTGTVKSALPSGLSFVLHISDAKADPKFAAKNDGSKMVGKNIELGVRMHIVDPASKATAHDPDDIASIKTLKPGMKINVDIFSVQKAPNVMRIKKPGEILDKQAKKVDKAAR
jgi:hypothetical protein